MFLKLCFIYLAFISLSECFPKACEVTNPSPNSQSHISLYDELYQCGVAYHADIPTKYTCVNLQASNKSDWALSISTHGTCVTAWHSYDCTGSSIQFKRIDTNTHFDLSYNAVAGSLAGFEAITWKKYIGSLSRCDYEKKCVVTNPKPDSKSHISLFDKINECGVHYHVDIPTKHTCVRLIASSKSDWALSISTHDTCVTAWYNYDCTGASIQLKPGDENSHLDLSNIAVAGESGKAWKKNIGSLSRCDYEKNCNVTNSKSDHQNQCDVPNHIDIDKHTCVNLKTSSKSKWALSIDISATCVTSWKNNNCTGPSAQLNLDSENFNSDLSKTAVARASGKAWKKYIGSLSRCDYEKKCEFTNPMPDSQSHISLFKEVNHCGLSCHFDIPSKHSCVHLMGNMSHIALSVSTHDTCVIAWHQYACCGPSIQLKPGDRNLHSDLRRNAIEGQLGKTWMNNIRSLSRCDYVKCKVTNPMPDSQSHISLFDELSQCGVPYHVDIPTNHTCMNLQMIGKSDWASSVSTYDTCVSAWYNFNCTGPSVHLKDTNGYFHSDLSSIPVKGESRQNWKGNIRSLSRCDYEMIVIDTTNSSWSNTTVIKNV